MHGRHGRYTKVNILALNAQTNATVLRQTALGDVKVRHDLDARNNGSSLTLGRRFNLVQHAVNAVAHDQPIFERLDVNVGRAGFERVGDNQADQANHRRFRRQIFELLNVVTEGVGINPRFEIAVVKRTDRRATTAVQALNGGVDIGADGNDAMNSPIGDQLKRVSNKIIERIGHGERQRVFVFLNRQRTRVAQKAGRNAFFKNGHFREGGGLNIRQIGLRSERLRDVPRGDDTKGGEQAAQFFRAG